MSTAKDEIQFKDLIVRLKQWWAYLLSKWLIIVCVGIAGGLLGLLYAFNSEPKYTASLNFILSNNDAGGGGLAGLAGQFGINLGDNTSDVFSGDNIISLMTSRNMVQKALQRKIPETNETLLNFIVKDGKMDEAWQQKDRTKGAYPFPADSVKLTRIQDSLFREIYKAVAKSFLSVSRPDKAQSIYVVSTTSNNELFSNYLTKYLVDVTSRFYIDTKTSVAKANLNMLQHEADSLNRLLGGSIASTAQVYDYTFNLNSALQSQRVPAQQGQVRITALGTAYGEVVKNIELAKITLQKETPLYQIIDEPQLPLEAEKPGKLFSLIGGGLLAGFFIVGFLIVRKIITSAG